MRIPSGRFGNHSVLTLLVLVGTSPCAVGQPIYFDTDVVPLLTKLGCNSGGCHGKAEGQNGFRLSLLGFEPEQDYEAIVKEARGRRLVPSAPAASLFLLKATGTLAHGGGKRLAVGSDDYQTLLRWMTNGSPPARSSDPTLARVTVTPDRVTFEAGNRRQPLKVVARFSDGTSRDVTRQAVYQSNEPDLAEVDDAGVVQVKNRSGLFAVMVRYGDQIAVFHGTVPHHQKVATGSALAAWEKANAVAGIDQHLVANWKRLGVVPSRSATDEEFIRRASLDICGTLPTPNEVKAYVADTQSAKRAKLIDRLLERPEYASYFALKWGDILRNRGRGYGTSQQRTGTALFAGWIRDSVADNVPYDRFVSELLTASGSQETNPPTVWYRTTRTSSEYVESVAQAFLGIRIQCAQCHHHPAERWSQADYFQLAAVFARVGRKGGFADAEVPTSETIFLADRGEVVHPRTGNVMRPRPPGGPDFELSQYDDPRRALAKWMTADDNPFFARTMANRMWGHFLGRGIIHPIDDARSTNPPSNPELLDALAKEFVTNRYDVKHLIRVICNSTAYGLSSIPEDANKDDVQSFARYYPRRLPAEVLLDGIGHVLESPTKFRSVAGDFPAGTRAIDLPDEAVPSQFLDVFGRPARNSACECERVDAPALGQTLALIGSPEIQDKLTADKGYVKRLAGNGKAHDENVRDIFLRVFGRPPRPKEAAAAVKYLESEADRKEGYSSLLWSLLATNEFLFNH
ncbi:MAG: S-layer protein [Planctomycetaceae bacterium]|nr:S-layer protein [Planctomycetaceae bacterium]